MVDDIGIAVLTHAREMLQIEEQHLLEHERGFTWWGGSLAQEVWAEPVIREAGTDVVRVHARTHLVRGFTPTPSHWQVVGALAAGTSMSAVVVDETEADRLRLHASMYAHREGLEWSRRNFAFAAAFQVSQAHTLAGSLPRVVEARPDASAHPEVGERAEHDEMLGLLEGIVRPRGREASPWSEEDADAAFEEVLGPLGITARRDGAVRWASLPGPGGDATLVLNPAAKHPALGWGALFRVVLPKAGPEAPSVATGLAWNGDELREHTRTHLLGSWYPDDGRLAHDLFLPAAAHLDGLLGHMLFGMALRTRWASRRGV